MTTSVRVLHVLSVKATAADTESLGLPPGSTLIRCTRLRLRHGEPYSHVVNDMPFEIGRRFTRSDGKGLVSRVLEQQLGIQLREAHQSIRASLADAELARLLKTRIGAPLLFVDRVVLTDNGRPVERVRAHYRSDIFSFRVHLSKDQSKQKWGVKNVRNSPEREEQR
jgi:GntR family transcriptional regulator